MESLLINVPIAAAVVGTTKMLLDHFSKERDKDREQLDTFLEQSVHVQKNTVTALTLLTERINRIL